MYCAFRKTAYFVVIIGLHVLVRKCLWCVLFKFHLCFVKGYLKADSLSFTDWSVMPSSVCVSKGIQIHQGLCIVQNLNSVQALANNSFTSFSTLLIGGLMKPDFFLERNEKLSNDSFIGLSILDSFCLIHEIKVCWDLCICLVCLKPVDVMRSFHLLTKVNVP